MLLRLLRSSWAMARRITFSSRIVAHISRGNSSFSEQVIDVFKPVAKDRKHLVARRRRHFAMRIERHDLSFAEWRAIDFLCGALPRQGNDAILEMGEQRVRRHLKLGSPALSSARREKRVEHSVAAFLGVIPVVREE